MKKEKWRLIPGYTTYKVSSHGRVKTLDKTVEYSDGRKSKEIKAHLLKLSLDKDGYPFVNLQENRKRKTVKVHSLVALAFIGPRPKNKEVRHKDGTKNNYYLNLTYSTHKRNMLDKIIHEIQPRGDDSVNSKLTEKQVRWARKHYVPYHARYGAAAMARKFGVAPPTMEHAIRGKLSWKYVR